MDIFYFILIILGLMAIMYLLIRFEKRTKRRYKKIAYNLLDTVKPGPQEIRDAIKGLRLYGGRWFKDKECYQLVERLQVKYDSLYE